MQEFGVRADGEERFLHASASYAAEKLDGSRARQTFGIDECEPMARSWGLDATGCAPRTSNHE